MTNKTGDLIKTENADWSFGGDVPDKFDSHVSRSVPLYNEGHELILKLSDYFLHDGSVCYDFGCSTGALIKKLTERIKADAITVTLGKDGCLVYKEGKLLKAPAFAGKVVDRVGAGDTLLAITALCFAAGVPKDLTMLFGGLAAAETIATYGMGNKLSKTYILKAVEALIK